MITPQYKNKLLKLIESSSILSEFYPDEFYSIKNFDPSLTFSNKVKKMDNLNKNVEKNYIYQNSIDFDIEELFINLKLENYKKCLDIISFNFENMLNLLGKNYTCSSTSNLAEKIKFMFYDKIISYSVYCHSLKIMEIINSRSNTLYNKRANRTGNNYFGSTEIVYTRNNSEQKVLTKLDVIIVIEHFMELLHIIDKNEYGKTISELKNLINYVK